MRILFLTSRFPFPLDKGDKLRAFHQVKELSRNHEIILASVSDQQVLPEHLDQLKPFCKKILVQHISQVRVVRNLIGTFFKRLPFQVGYFYSPKFSVKLRTIIETEKPDVIFCQLVRMAEYVKKVNDIPATLDYMDAFSTGLERLSHRSSWLKRIFVKMEWKRMLKYEQDVFTRFQAHTIISDQDKKLIPHPKHDSIAVVPNGVDMEFYHPLERDKKYDLIFSGNMAYPPNVESVLFIANEVLPALVRKNPETRWVIAGASPGREILALKSRNIEVTGWVDDMRSCFAESRIHLAPMLISIGLQNKILQAMAMKIPCIVSSLANNAIHAPVNECLLIADSPEEYVEKISLLLEDDRLRERLADNAYQFIQKNFQWSEAVRKLEVSLKFKV